MQRKLNVKTLGDKLNDTYVLAQYITEYSTKSQSRYKHLTQIQLFDKNVILANANPWDTIVVPHSGFTEFKVTAAEENRIDIVATKLYGNAALYWVICYANGIEDPTHLPVGTNLIIPKLEDLYQYPNPLT